MVGNVETFRRCKKESMAKIRNKMIALFGVFALAVSTAVAAPGASSQYDSLLERQVYKKIISIPRYNVFDHLAFKVEGSTVVLLGQVVRPTTRKEAERRVAKIEGVDRVVNKIEVLPLSSFDDSIRIRTYRAVFSAGSLYRYAQGVNPSIRIVVSRGHVTLEGFVASKGDRNLAYIAASQVPGTFSVTNNLRVER